MARACAVCTHPARKAINAAIIEGMAPGGPTDTAIAERFAISAHSIFRHKRQHLRPALEQVQNTTQPAPVSPSTTPHTASAPDPQDVIEAREAIASVSQEPRKLLDRVEFLWNESVDGLKDAREAKDLKARASFIGQGRKVAELGGLATGELRRDDPGTQRTVVVVLPPAGLPGVTPRPALEDGDGPVIDLVPTA